MTWKPGVSGNPSGRPKSKIQSRTITDLARSMAPEALKMLAKIMNDPKSSSTARAIAADRILDRAYGKPPQAVGVLVAPSRKASDYTDEELAAIVARALPAPTDSDDVLELEAMQEETAEDFSASDGNKDQYNQ